MWEWHPEKFLKLWQQKGACERKSDVLVTFSMKGLNEEIRDEVDFKIFLLAFQETVLLVKSSQNICRFIL